MTSPLDQPQLRLLDALVARILPGDRDDPGAREAGAVDYILRTLTTTEPAVGGLYRDGLDRLDSICQGGYGAGFADLDPQDQDTVLGELCGRAERELQAGGLPRDALLRFFLVVCEHTLQGMFGDPVHGGNRDAVGWRLIGFPGVQWGYTAEQMRPGYDATTIPVRSVTELVPPQPGS